VTDLSVVIVTWNTRGLVLECLESLAAALREAGKNGRIRAEVLVVDNGSNDGTVGAVRDRFPEAHVEALPENVGFAAGCNVGLRIAAGRHVLLLNSDARVPPATLARCIDYLDANPGVGVVGPQLLHADGRRQTSIHRAPTLLTELFPKSLFQLIFPRRHPSWRSVGQTPMEVEALTGAVLFVRSETLRDAGPLPEDYFFFLEETEWCRRVRRAGWGVVHLPDVVATHLSGGSSKRRDPARTRIEYHRSLYHFFRANRGAGWMAMVFCTRLLKSLLYVVTQAPLAVFAGRGRERWQVHRTVLGWHLRGCPQAGGLAGRGAAAFPPLDAVPKA
jgi:GT2 family glycosyltransferase